MKRVRIFLFSIFLVLGMAGAASAMTFTDVTQFTAAGIIQAQGYVSHGWGDVNFLSSPVKSPLQYNGAEWEHKVTFNPPVLQIISGTVKLSLQNKVNVFELLNRTELDQYVFGWTEICHWGIVKVDNAEYTDDANGNFLADGVSKVEIAAVGGDPDTGKSEVTNSDNSVPVPEPTSMLLLGLGLIGLTGAKRKFNK